MRELYEQSNNQADLNANVTVKEAVAYGKITARQALGPVGDEAAREALDYVGDWVAELVEQGFTSWDEIRAKYFTFNKNGFSKEAGAAEEFFGSADADIQEAVTAYAEAMFRARLAEKERPYALDYIKQKEEEAAEKYNTSAEALEAEMNAAKEASGELTTLQKAANGDADAMTDLETATNNANEALAAMADYAENVHKSVESSVKGVIKGFDRVRKAGDELRDKNAEYEAEYKDKEDQYRLNKDIRSEWRDSNGNLDLQKMQANYKNLNSAEQEAYNTLAAIYKKQQEINQSANEYKPANMIANLDSQLRFMQEYTDNLKTLKSWGLSDEFLASMSDGSAESAEYLYGLVQGGSKAAKEVEAKYKEVQASQKQFTDTLTDTQLAGDETYQKLFQDAQKAVEKLGEISGSAGSNAKAIANAVAMGINEEMPNVKSAVDGIIAQLDRLTSLNVSISMSASGSSSRPRNYVTKPIGEFEIGLDRVPYTGFLASLHEGEGILTAEENRVWQRFKNGGGGGVDYDAMGNVMRDNIKPGGNVYMDGRVVGSVISEQQGKSFRQLQRSGWQG